MSNHARYVIMTPVRNEAANIEMTMKSVAGQTLLPLKWIIVDDGSTDNTAELVERFAQGRDWVQLERRQNRGFRNSGAGIAEAVLFGYQKIKDTSFDFIVKLDGDLIFPPGYFMGILGKFDENPRLGICGGGVFIKTGGGEIYEKNPKFHVRGATKIYRTECWRQIGGIIPQAGWDTVDEIKANMMGWETETFPEFKVIQARPTGGATGWWRDSVKNGRANYVACYHPLFFFLRVIRHLAKKPYLVKGIGLAYGFLSSYALGVQREENPEYVRYIRKQQMARLFVKDTIWK